MVGTPGRLEDLISTGKLDLSAIRFFVLDEAVSNMFFFTFVMLLFSSFEAGIANTISSFK